MAPIQKPMTLLPVVMTGQEIDIFFKKHSIVSDESSILNPEQKQIELPFWKGLICSWKNRSYQEHFVKKKQLIIEALAPLANLSVLVCSSQLVHDVILFEAVVAKYFLGTAALENLYSFEPLLKDILSFDIINKIAIFSLYLKQLKKRAG